MSYQPGCGHCPGGFGLASPLVEGERFWVVCDIHPLVGGHILVIPREHISCVGALNLGDFLEFKDWYEKVSQFIKNNYGPLVVFEHGITGQTVFHSHVHFLPFKGQLVDIISQADEAKKIDSLDQIQEEFKAKGQYLFLEVASQKYLIDTAIGQPRFFRELLAKALGAPERADWRATEKDPLLMQVFTDEILRLKDKWQAYRYET
jgi:diadenosine tetraphosphate (Ap4A) HIT family hydrolase